MKKKYVYPSLEVTEQALRLALLHSSGGGDVSDPDDQYKEITRQQAGPEGGRLC